MRIEVTSEVRSVDEEHGVSGTSLLAAGRVRCRP